MKHRSKVVDLKPAEILSHPVLIILEHLIMCRRSLYIILIKDLLTMERAPTPKAQSLGSQWESIRRGPILETTPRTIQSIRLILLNRSTTQECKGTSLNLRQRATISINSHQESDRRLDLRVILPAMNCTIRYFNTKVPFLPLISATLLFTRI